MTKFFLSIAFLFISLTIFAQRTQTFKPAEPIDEVGPSQWTTGVLYGYDENKTVISDISNPKYVRYDIEYLAGGGVGIILTVYQQLENHLRDNGNLYVPYLQKFYRIIGVYKNGVYENYDYLEVPEIPFVKLE